MLRGAWGVFAAAGVEVLALYGPAECNPELKLMSLVPGQDRGAEKIPLAGDVRIPAQVLLRFVCALLSTKLLCGG